ncbi:Unknown protein [Striga hermonthica]|uniref:Uncharacterized protein n=1 Tax=Striga hermonthica TaxID=68872 RepID=A0A9N7R6C1_STRHE|nr:Unknown protein [Striga hermonthica]
MAIEIFPDSPSLVMSPRISFSHDLTQSDVVPVEQYVSPSSTVDFDFCVFRGSFDLDQPSSADELFSGGKILPIEIKRRLAPPKKFEEPLPTHPPPYAPIRSPPPPKSGAKIAAASPESEEKQRSFWRFKRSTSLNCGSGYARTLCPLPLLSRSNSTGSAASGKRTSAAGNQKQTFVRGNSSNTSQKQGGYNSRPPLKKSHIANGVKFNPLMNVPPANFFGLGSFFSGGRVSRRKK